MGTVNRNWSRKALPVKHKLPKKPKNLLVFKKLGIAFLITAIAVFCYVKLQPHTQEAKQERQLQTKSQQLQQTINQLEKQKTLDKQNQEKLNNTQKQLQETQKKLEAKRHAAVAYAASLPPQTTYSPPVAVANCGSDPNMAYIYQHESGCRTNAVGPNGPCGLGQALPCSKMPCSLSDWVCQNNFFVGYAISKYGSTYAAYLFWIAHNWW